VVELADDNDEVATVETTAAEPLSKFLREIESILKTNSNLTYVTTSTFTLAMLQIQLQEAANVPKFPPKYLALE
jgi:hypothetical protein